MDRAALSFPRPEQQIHISIQVTSRTTSNYSAIVPAVPESPEAPLKWPWFDVDYMGMVTTSHVVLSPYGGVPKTIEQGYSSPHRRGRGRWLVGDTARREEQHLEGEMRVWHPHGAHSPDALLAWLRKEQVGEIQTDVLEGRE